MWESGGNVWIIGGIVGDGNHRKCFDACELASRVSARGSEVCRSMRQLRVRVLWRFSSHGWSNDREYRLQVLSLWRIAGLFRCAWRTGAGRMHGGCTISCNNTVPRSGNSEKYENKHFTTQRKVRIIRGSTISASSRNICAKVCIISRVEAPKHQHSGLKHSNTNEPTKLLYTTVPRWWEPLRSHCTVRPMPCTTPALSVCTDGAPLVQMVWCIIGSLAGVEADLVVSASSNGYSQVLR